MKKPSAKNVKSQSTRRRHVSQGRKLVSQSEMLLMRVEAAEITWKQAKEQVSQAKRRRKLAKLLARRAKKDAKTAKTKLDELRDALARAQEQPAMNLKLTFRKPRKTKGRNMVSKKRLTTRRPLRKPRTAAPIASVVKSEAGSPESAIPIPEIVAPTQTGDAN